MALYIWCASGGTLTSPSGVNPTRRDQLIPNYIVCQQLNDWVFLGYRASAVGDASIPTQELQFLVSIQRGSVDQSAVEFAIFVYPHSSQSTFPACGINGLACHFEVGASVAGGDSNASEIIEDGDHLRVNGLRYVEVVFLVHG